LKNYLGTGSASVIAAGLLLSVGGSGQALAQQVNNLPVVQAVVNTTDAVSAVASTAQATGLASDTTVAKEAGWLSQNGWPLYALVDKFSAGAPLTDEANCIAVAVYHEARGESLEGQMAVAAYPTLRARFVPCLNGSPELADVLAAQVMSAH